MPSAPKQPGRERPLKVGLLGAGVVGGGVIELLEARGPELGLELKRIAVRDLARRRDGIPEGVLLGTVEEIVRDDDIDIVVEVMGGLDPALRAVRSALECGKDVVTANKILVSEHGDELRGIARSRKVRFRYEASVAGCLPIVEIIEAGLIFDRVERLFGILNGTCNFILTRCQQGGLNYEGALLEARRAGFAEADPSLDVSGADTSQKLAILVGLITGRHCPVDAISVNGIESLVREDHLAAEEIGWRIKLLGSYVRRGLAGHVRVAPTLVPAASALGLTTDEYNCVEVECSHIGWQLYLGKGAGRMPTAAAVLHDLASIAKKRRQLVKSDTPIWDADTVDLPGGNDAAVAAHHEAAVEADPQDARPLLECLPADAWRTSWLVRLPAENPPWPVSRIGASFFQHGIEIVEYRRSKHDSVGALVVTSKATVGAIQSVARDIRDLPGTIRPPVVLAMEPDA